MQINLVIFIILVVNTSWASAGKTKITETWGKTIKSGKDHTTTLQFYFHDTTSGKFPTVVQVARPVHSNQYPAKFGILAMADDPLRDGPDPKSKLVGRAQGLYGYDNKDELGLIMAFSYTFSDGSYNGSSISIMGRNPIMHPVRELAVVGGTGLFRMARGYAIAHTYWFDVEAGDAIVGYNLTIVH